MNTNLLHRIMESRGEFPPGKWDVCKEICLKNEGLQKNITKVLFYKFVVVNRIGVKCLSPHFSFCIRIIKPC